MKKLAVIVGAVGFFGMANAALAQSDGADEDTKWYVGGAVFIMAIYLIRDYLKHKGEKP